MQRLPTWYLVVCLFLLVTLLSGCPTPEERAEEARAEARHALETGQRAEAVAALKRLRATQPDTPEALNELVGLLIQAGEAPQAVWVLEEGLERFPERDDLRLSLATTALLTNNPSLAGRTLRAIPASSEQHATSLLLLAQAELQLGHLGQALDLLAAGERTYPEIAQFNVSRIATLLAENRFDEARVIIARVRGEATPEVLAHLRRQEASLNQRDVQARIAAEQSTSVPLARLSELVDEDSEDLTLWQALVESSVRAGRLTEALERLESATKESPDHVALLYLTAQLRAMRGEPEEAQLLLEAVVERVPSPSAYLALGNFLMGRDQAQDAERIYAVAALAFPEAVQLRKYRVEALLALDDLDGARAEFGRFRELAPHDPHVEYLIARLELAEGDADAAVARLRELVPDFDQAATQFWLGAALEAAGDPAGASRRYQLAIIRDPAQPAPYRGAIHLAEQRGDWRAVVGLAELLVVRVPGAVDGWLALLQSLLQLEEPEQAEKLARQGVQRFPEDPEVRSLWVRALLASGRFDEAMQALDDAVSKTGASPALDAERALALGIAGRVAEGLALANEALEKHPDEVRLHGVRAALSFQAGDAETGAAAVERALDLSPENPSPLRMRAQFRAATGRLEGARADCERYLAIRPEDTEVHFILAVVHEKAGRFDAAIRSYRRAAELDRNSFEPRNNLADLLQRRGDLDAALEMAQEAYALADDNPYVADTLGWMYVEKGLVDRGVSLLEEAHRGIPEHPVVQLHLALAYLEASRRDDARRLLVELRPRAQADAALLGQVDDALRSLE